MAQIAFFHPEHMKVFVEGSQNLQWPISMILMKNMVPKRSISGYAPQQRFPALALARHVEWTYNHHHQNFMPPNAVAQGPQLFEFPRGFKGFNAGPVKGIRDPYKINIVNIALSHDNRLS